MEHSFRAQTKGLTQFKCVQIISDPAEPCIIHSLDSYMAMGVPGRFTGVGLGSETRLMMSIHPFLGENRTVRYFSLFIEGGDAQPTPRNEDDVRQKKVVSLDTSSSPYLRERVAQVVGIPVDRDPFVRALARDPELFNRLWEDPLFTHVNAFQWYGDFPLQNGRTLTHIRLITIRDIDLICRVHCLTNPKIDLEDVLCFPYTKGPESQAKD
ncbi:MAG: hypothetical protein IJU76_16055 [Desulfovibrionaceae bacterium]|nr:hypothetical protein [Desulfovibrionaceae bacterium]